MLEEKGWRGKLIKVVVSTSMGKMDKSMEELCQLALSKICSQEPTITKMRKSISNFGIRKGMKVGGKVTLRGEKAINFWLKLLLLVLPANPLFRGFKKSTINSHTVNFGLRSIGNFPEFMEVKRDIGINVSMVFSNDVDLGSALTEMKVPFLT